MLLRITPTVPRSLDGRINQLEPLGLSRIARWRRQREQLPSPFVADHRHYWLTSRPAHVAIRARVLRIGGHEPLLYGEDEIVSSAKSGRWHWRIVSTQASLKCSDGLAQRLRRLGVVVEMECLDIVQQTVGLRKQRPPACFASSFLSGSGDRRDHGLHHSPCGQIVKYRFTSIFSD